MPMVMVHSSLEHGGNSPLDIDAILSITSLDADLILDMPVVEVDADGLVDVRDIFIPLKEQQRR